MRADTKLQSAAPLFVVLVLYSVAVVLLGTWIGSIYTLESIARGRHDAPIGIYYRARNMHVHVFRKHPRFITFASAESLYYYQHVDETSEQQFSFSYPHDNNQDYDIHPFDEDHADNNNSNTSAMMENDIDIATAGSISHSSSISNHEHASIEKRHYFHPSYNPPPLIEAFEVDDDDSNTEHVFLSVARNQTLYEEFSNFLPPDTFAGIARCLSNHSEIFANPLDDAFSGTTGFATLFSGRSGVRRFLEEKRFNCDHDGSDFNPLAAYFNQALDPLATGFVMNVLVADNSNNNINSNMAVYKHVDNTLDHTIPNSGYLPNTVSVLYLNVPHDMKGGHLDIFSTDSSAESNNNNIIEASIFPEMNKMARFRGDAYHQVRAYTTEEITEKRISLVLEQYRVLPRHEKYLTEYRTVVKNGMTMI